MAELSLYAKLINSIYNLVNGQPAEMPLYHGNDIPYFIEPDRGSDIEHISPEKACISSRALQELVSDIMDDWRMHVAGFGLMSQGKIVYEHYASDHLPGFRHVSFSMSKSIVSMAVGIAIEQGILTLDEKLCDIFPEHNSIFFKRGMRQITIENLLTMTAGVIFDEMSSYYSMDWCKDYMGSETAFAPGSDFAYNSLNTYMLVAAITRKSGQKFMDYITENLFEPLNIHDISWDKCPMGIEKGGWGLKLSVPDMLKLGQLYMNRGRWMVNGRNRQIISEDWIRRSVYCHVSLDEKRVVKGYGYHIWLLKDGAYLFNGVFGQNIYVHPERQIVIAVTASAYELFPDGRLVERLCRFAADDRNFVRDNMFAALKKGGKINIKHIRDERNNVRLRKYKKQEARELIAPYLGNVYYFEDYASDIVPFATQVLYSNFMSGIKTICFDMEKNVLVMKVMDSDQLYIIRFDEENAEPGKQILTVNGKEYCVIPDYTVECDSDLRMRLKIKIVYPEEVSDKYFSFCFYGDELECRAQETPDLLRFAELLMGEKKMLRTRKLEGIKIPDYLEYKIRKLTTPVSVAHVKDV